MEEKVFCSFIEVAPMPGCQLDPQEVAGAAVRCYVTAQDAHSAEERCRVALSADHFRVVDVEWCVAEDETEWEHPENEDHALHVQAAATAPCEVVYGEFHSWGYDAKDS